MSRIDRDAWEAALCGSKLSAAERWVLLRLTHYASLSPDRCAYPKRATLVFDTGLSESTIKRALRRFAETGLVRVAQRGGGRGIATRFELAEKPPLELLHERPAAARSGWQRTPKTGPLVTRFGGRKRVTEDRRNRVTRDPHLSLSRIDQIPLPPRRAVRRAPVPDDPGAWSLASACDELMRGFA